MKPKVSSLTNRHLSSKENKTFNTKNSKISKRKILKATIKSKNEVNIKGMNMLVNSVKSKIIPRPFAYHQYIKSKIISNNIDSGKESGGRCRKDS